MKFTTLLENRAFKFTLLLIFLVGLFILMPSSAEAKKGFTSRVGYMGKTIDSHPKKLTFLFKKKKSLKKPSPANKLKRKKTS